MPAPLHLKHLNISVAHMFGDLKQEQYADLATLVHTDLLIDHLLWKNSQSWYKTL